MAKKCIVCTGPLQAWEIDYHLDCGRRNGWPDAEVDWLAWNDEYNERLDARREMEIAEAMETSGAQQAEALGWHRKRMTEVSKSNKVGDKDE